MTTRLVYRAAVAALVACAAVWSIACAQGTHVAPGAGRYAHDVEDAVPKVERAVGLKFKTPPKVEPRSKAEVRAFLEKEFATSHAEHDIAGSELAQKMFGLIPDTMHLRAELENLLTEQIVGFYDPKTKVLYVVDGAPANEVTTVISHELVHALQDQYMNLDSLQSIEGDDDRAAAAQAVIEGQAVFDQLVAMLGGISTCMSRGSSRTPTCRRRRSRSCTPNRRISARGRCRSRSRSRRRRVVRRKCATRMTWGSSTRGSSCSRI
jgi:hypothetical protein